MVAYVVDSTKVGSSLVSSGGTMTAITVSAPPIITDKDTSIYITDGRGGRVIYSATELALVHLFEPRPGVALTPGTSAPPFPRALFSGAQVFTSGLYVQNCPTGISLTVSA